MADQRQQPALPARGLPRQRRDRRHRHRLLARLRPAACARPAVEAAAAGNCRRCLGRRLAQPAPDLHHPLPGAGDARVVAGRLRERRAELLPRGAPVRPSVRGDPWSRPLQLRRYRRDHARGHSLVGSWPGRGRGIAGAHLPAADAVRDPSAGTPAHGAGDRVPTHHAQQRHDAREHHRHRRGHAARPHPLERLHGLRRRCAGAVAAGLHLHRPSVRGYEPRVSRLSRRLEVRERKRTGGTAGPVSGLEISWRSRWRPVSSPCCALFAGRPSIGAG